MSGGLAVRVDDPERVRPGGRYELTRLLAQGGMGAIWLAHDHLAQRDVAFKRLAIPTERERALRTALFQREYDTLARLPHPNIVEVYDYGQDAEGPYYVMELLGGSDLTQLAPLPFREACRVLRDVASALALVHARRLVHRDVSPNNVRLTSDGRAKLIDFGALTSFGRPREIVGTPACLAPEALTAAPLDQRSDLYSLGAVAYWLLTRKLAVRARTLDELPQALREPVVPPSRHVAEIPHELDELVLSLLARDPLARPANAAYLIDRLTAIGDLLPESDERRVAASYLAHPPLVGRERALARLSQAVEGARTGQGEALIVEATSGLGRSALLDEAALRAQLSGSVVLRVKADASTGPFGLARQLVEKIFALHPDLGSTSAFRVSSHTYLPTGGKPQAVPTAFEIAERHAGVIEAAEATLFDASRRHPLVLLIDDVHESDGETLALLASLAQSLEQNQLTLIASRLSSAPLDENPAYAKLEASAERLWLTLLAEDDVIALVQALFGDIPNSGRLALWLHAQSGGNPATCLDVLRLLLQRGRVRYTLGTFTLPNDVEVGLAGDLASGVALARIADLPVEVRRVALVLSLHRGALSVEQLASATGSPVRDVLLALEELITRAIAAKSEHGFAFSAESLRDALARSIGDEEQKATHARLARALLANPIGGDDVRFPASLHLLRAGAENEALELVVGVAHTSLQMQLGAHWGALAEGLLEVCQRQGRSEEQCLSLRLPVATAGYYGELALQQRHIDAALASLSHVAGMSLASRMRRFVGGKLALLMGLVYAGFRRGFKPARERLGTVAYMLRYFVGLACNAVAAAVSALETRAAERYLTWLEPLSVLPKESSANVMREFCLATVEIARGEFEQASARYERLLPILSKPFPDLSEPVRRNVYLGCLNGRATCEAANSSPVALELADELGKDVFFAPHAEVARMAYYANRGEHDRAEVHRARAELLALRGGTSWSAAVVLATHVAHACTLTHDAIGLVRSNAECERLSAIAPKLGATRRISEAWLEHLRGRSDRARTLMEAVIDTSEARELSTWCLDRTLYATILNALGDHARAKEVASALLATGAPDLPGSPRQRGALRQLAIAEAGLGDLARAEALLEQSIEQALALDNPLELGSAHRDRAQVALLAGDRAAFDAHWQDMGRYFRATRNPSLIQQCDALLAQAVRAGIRSPATASIPTADDDEFDGSTVVESNTLVDDGELDDPEERVS